MLSFNTLYTRYTTVTRNAESANTTIAKQHINESQHHIIGSAFNGEWPFLERTRDLTSVASTATYELPADCRKIESVQFQNSSTDLYNPEPVESADHLEYLLRLNLAASNQPQYFYHDRRLNQIIFIPTISSASKTMRIRYRRIVKDMVQADYTTGNITTWTNGDDDVTGSSTSWTTGMAGDYIRITATAAAAGGDGLWYEIESIGSATALVTVKNYLGTSLAAASAAYTIGEMPVIPEAYHELLIWRPLALYYDQNPDMGESKKYWLRYDGGFEAGFAPRVGGMLANMIDEAGSRTEVTFELPLDHRKVLDPNFPPHDLTGGAWT